MNCKVFRKQMGCGFSTPLVRSNKVLPIKFEKRLDAGNAEDDGQIKGFLSFGSFVLENDNPSILGWAFQREIGKGAMSRVFAVTHMETGTACAAKVYDTRTLDRPTLGVEGRPGDEVRREINIMGELQHRYIMPLIDLIDDVASNGLILVLPFATYGTLQDFVGKASPSEAVLTVCFLEIAESLRYMHSMNVVHRDVKPDNILVFSEEIFRLADFSVSTSLEDPDQKLTNTKGSPAFLSPEECSGEAFAPKPADVWAYGVTLYKIVFGFLPFGLDEGQGRSVANTVFMVMKLLESEELFIPEDRNVSPHLVAVMRQILDKDPAKRPTFEQLIGNQWFDPARDIDKRNMEDDAAQMQVYANAPVEVHDLSQLC